MKSLEAFKRWLPTLWEATFKTEDEIVDDLLSVQLDDESKDYLRMLGDADRLYETHHTLGRWVRNTYRLWDAKNPITQNIHADDLSHQIITSAYLHLKNGR